MCVPREGGKVSFSCTVLESSSVVMEENERKIKQLRSNFTGAGPKLGLRVLRWGWVWAELEIPADPSAVLEVAQENSPAEKLQLSHPWKLPRPGWSGPGATWDSGKCPWMGWDRMGFKSLQPKLLRNSGIHQQIQEFISKFRNLPLLRVGRNSHLSFHRCLGEPGSIIS